VSRVVEISSAQSSEEHGRRVANQLLNATMSYGRLILRRYGELGPYGFSMDREGQIARETLEIPRLPADPNRLWKLLQEHIVDRARRRLIQAVAMAANVTLDEPSAEGYQDAVFVEIEEAHGYAVHVTIPYRIYGGQLHNLLPRRIAIGKMLVEDAAGHIFAGASSHGLS
jgi:hypothetical protein